MSAGIPIGSPDWVHQALGVGTALACGLLIGVERGWKLKDAKPGQRVAGVRTFTLLGLGSGIAGLLGTLGHPVVSAAIAIGAVAIMVTAYARELKQQHDSTSAVAALVTIAIGFLAGAGSAGLAIACAAVAVALLALKSELHGFVDRLKAEDVKALARYLVIAGGVLPFLPNRYMGPLNAWNPQRLWLVVVLVTGFSFLGYVANRLFGERHGTIATALIGGAYSSTAVTQSLAQRLGSSKSGGAEPAGIALATAVMYLRVTLVVAILSTRVLPVFAALMAGPFVVGAVAGWILYRRAPSHQGPEAPGNPIAIVPALGFLVFVAVAAVAARWASGRFGEQGIAGLLLITGTMDVDTAIITLGGLSAQSINAHLAGLALAGTVLANMTVKLGITLAYARRKGVSAALALGASMVALVISIAVGWLLL
ncbi:MAG: MgtC/SapB family protein [Pseudomonadota bacterium]|nr:MgtC/SapB family protein [Pseudomonadota bacterium]